jgi:acetate kinase
MDVAPRGQACRVQVIPTNEELLIARDSFRIVRGLPLA